MANCDSCRVWKGDKGKLVRILGSFVNLAGPVELGQATFDRGSQAATICTPPALKYHPFVQYCNNLKTLKASTNIFSYLVLYQSTEYCCSPPKNASLLTVSTW